MHADATLLAQRLMQAVQKADKAVKIRVEMKNDKLRTFTSKQASALGSYTVKMESDSAGVRVSVGDGSGRVVTTRMAMGKSDVDALMQALDPSATIKGDISAD